MMSSRERAARPEVTRSELAQLVRWMLDSGLYDTEDVVDAIVKPNRYEDELFAAVRGVDQESFDAAIALREATVGLKAVLSDGWSVRQPTVLDTAVLCRHGVVVIDTQAAREGRPVSGTCEAGCTALGSGLVDQPYGGAVVAFRLTGRRTDRSARSRTGGHA